MICKIYKLLSITMSSTDDLTQILQALKNLYGPKLLTTCLSLFPDNKTKIDTKSVDTKSVDTKSVDTKLINKIKCTNPELLNYLKGLYYELKDKCILCFVKYYWGTHVGEFRNPRIVFLDSGKDFIFDCNKCQHSFSKIANIKSKHVNIKD